ncbi:MAG: hypothetical protein Q4B29_00750 [Candidatus Saccharibacteria bacterium]|nr:hypothetical protein [Candidatus Saccharibacteria bacterium]
MDGNNGGNEPMGPQNVPGGQGNFGQPNNQDPMMNAPQGPQMGPQGQFGPQMGPNMPPQGPMPGYGQPMMQPGYGPQMPMQPMRPPKQPMDPKKKKKIIIGVSVGLGVAILAAVAVVVVMMLLKVDYSEAYLKAKDMNSRINAVYLNSDCSNVLSYVKSSYRDIEEYNEYIEGCKKTTNGVKELVDDLGSTAAVQRDEKIKAQYGRFLEAFDATLPNTESLGQKLDLYQAWHKFIVLVDDLDYGDPDSEFKAATESLINSGNETLKVYGEGYLERSLELSHAYTAFDSLPYGDSNRSTLRNEYYNKRSELQAWVDENAPDITTVAPLEFTGGSTMWTEWRALYDLISETYELNYDQGSGNCTEFLGEVVCN